MEEQNPTPPASETPPPDELATLRAQLEESQTALAEFRERYAGAVGSLLDTARATNPTIPAELIAGTTPDEIAASLQNAVRIRDAVITMNASSNGHGKAVTIVPQVPAGGAAPPPPFDRDASPYDKVRAAIAAAHARTH